MINSAYGKTMENLRKRISVKLVNNEKGYLEHTSKPTFISQKIIDKNYATIYEIKPVLTLNKQFYVGFTVFELSKWLILDFHYNFTKKIAAELLFTDTDSLTYEIKSEDIYEDFYKNKYLFHLSYYPAFDPANEKVIGKMKDAYNRKQINEFVELKSKCIVLFLVMVNNFF